MNKKILIIIFIFLGLFNSQTLISFSTPYLIQNDTYVSNKNQNVVNIGVLLPITSYLDRNGILDGIKSAVLEINSSADYKFKINLVIKDVKEADKAVSAYNELKNANVQLIIGPAFSSTAENVAELSEIDKIVLISYSASSPSLNNYSYFFRTIPTEEKQLEVLADLMLNLSYTDTGIIYENSGYLSSQEVLDNFTHFEEHFILDKQKVLFKVGYEPNRYNHSAILAKIMEFQNLDSLVIIATQAIDSVEGLLQSFDKNNISIPIFSTNLLPTFLPQEKDILTNMDADEGLITITPLRRFYENVRYNDFLTSLSQCNSQGLCSSGSIPNFFAGYAYDAVKIGALAINYSETITGPDIKNNMIKASQMYKGVTGNKTFDKYGNPTESIFDILQIHDDSIQVVGYWSLSTYKNLNNNFIMLKTNKIRTDNTLVYVIPILLPLIIVIAFIYLRKIKKDPYDFKDFFKSDKILLLKEMHYKISVGLTNQSKNMINLKESPQLTVSGELEQFEANNILEFFPETYRQELTTLIRGRSVLVLIELAYLPYTKSNISSLAQDLVLPRSTVHNEMKLLMELGYITLYQTTETLQDTRYKYYTLTERGAQFLLLLKEIIQNTLTKIVDA